MLSESLENGISEYPDGSFRTPDGKFASRKGEAAPGTMKADEFAAFLKNNGMNVVGTELVVQGPVGDRRYDIVVRDANGKLHGIEIKSGSASKDSYQRFTDYFINQFGANGKGRISGERVESAITVYVP
jgi:filamentous hemagglutinin